MIPQIDPATLTKILSGDRDGFSKGAAMRALIVCGGAVSLPVLLGLEGRCR